MSISITYDKFFRITNCDAIIFLEDDFIFEDNKENFFYGLTRLNRSIRERMYAELKEAGADFVDKLQDYSVTVEGYIESIDWENEIPRDDVKTLFTVIDKEGGVIGAKLQEIYASIETGRIFRIIMTGIANKSSLSIKYRICK